MSQILNEQTLTALLNLPKKNEWVEFKEAKVQENFDEIGKYFSMISNEAFLRDKEFGWLVFGVGDKINDNKQREIVGTRYKQGTIDDLKTQIKQHTNNLTFIEIYENYIDDMRILCFKIPPAFNANPTTWKGVAYGRESDKREQLSAIKFQQILESKKVANDWSAQICEGAAVEDLDEEAVQMAKQGYIKKLNNQQEAEIVRNFSTQRFLEEINATTKTGDLTNTALLLFGNKKAELKLGCGFATEIAYLEITYKVDEDFRLPFQKSIYDLISKISVRQLEFQTKIAGQYTGNNYFRDNYREEDLRECIANCVAHQDYSQHQRIEVYETIHKEIEFRNAGASLYSKAEFDLIRQRKMKPSKYRNEFLARVMREIGLMESKGKGHAQIFDYNTKEVYLPLPQVDWENKNDFALTLYGASLDPNFAKILQQKTDLEATEILLLDQVQKGFKINQTAFNRLKKKGLVEGTPTKGKLSFEFMKLIGKEDEYIDRSEDEHLKILIYKKISKTKDCKRQDIEDYIYPKFSEHLDDKKKYTKLTNLLALLKNEKWIESVGGRKYATWVTKREMKME